MLWYCQVLDYLLPEMENRRGKLVVVLAGYKKPMEERVMAYNEGLPSRYGRQLRGGGWVGGDGMSQQLTPMYTAWRPSLLHVH
jgi:hypothetical protein